MEGVVIYDCGIPHLELIMKGYGEKMAAVRQRMAVALIIAGIIGFGGAAYAETVTEIRDSAVRVSVSGQITDASKGTPVSFYLTKDGVPACIEQGTLAADGGYSFEFLANPKFGSGSFSYSVKARGADVQTGNLDIVDVAALETLLPELSGAGSAAGLKALMSGLDPALNLPVYDPADSEEWYRVLYNEISGENAPGDAAAFYRLMRQSAVTSAINVGKADMLLDGKLQYIDVIGLDAAVVAAYENELSEKGRAAVNKYIMSEKYNTTGDCGKALRRLILTNRITHNALSDLAVVQANLLADGSELGLSLDKAKGKEKEVARQLVKNGAETPQELLAAYDNICKSLTVTTGGGNGGGGNGGGGGNSGSGGSGGYQPSIKPAETAKNAGSGFSDMENYVWADNAVAKLKEIGAVSGKSGTEFAPGDNVKREEFVKMVLQAFGLMNDADGTQSGFADVDGAEWYAPYVVRAAGLGIISGVSEREFGIGKPITRQDMAAISFRALRYKISDFDTDTAAEGFTDIDEIGEYARTPVMILKKLQVVNGYSDGSFRPQQTASRAEAAQMIFSMIMLGEE